MAPASPSASNTVSSIPTAQDITTSGGVWAPTSAKREKLAELKIELADPQHHGLTLDDFATGEQKLDLYLADGLLILAQIADSNTNDAANNPFLQQVESIWAHLPAPDLTKDQWQATLLACQRQVEQQLATIPADRCLRDLRDFYLPTTEEEEQSASVDSTSVQSQAEQAVLRYRLLLAKAAIDHLLESWDTLTTVSDQDIDRAAVIGENLDKQASTLSASALRQVLSAYLNGSCAEQVDAVWNLCDRDRDGLIDEEEMKAVCEMAIEPTRKALGRLFAQALEAYPVRAPLTSASEDTSQPGVPRPAGYRQRRREAAEKKRLMKMFDRTLKVHFLDEVEMPHRLRCIYAWANKSHQDNKIDSVLVEESGWSGRKRYVELHPKISLPEFREVQQEHFTHLDRVGSEFVKSFREDLWILQGKGRQRQQLMRNSSLFMGVVCLIDYIVTTL